MVPFSKTISISKKIKSNTERNRLKKIVESIKPKNFGVIIRTVSEGKGVAELAKRLNGPDLKMGTICYRRLQTAEPAKKVLGEMDRTSTILRDILSDEFTNIYINDPVIYEETRSYIQDISPDLEKIVKLYKQSQPIFEHFGVEKTD